MPAPPSNPLPPPEDARLPAYTDVDKVPLSLLGQLSGHWRAMYLAQKRQHDVSVRQIVWGQLITVLVVGGASYFLEANKAALLLAGGILILYPALTNMFSSNAAALGGSLHHEIDSGQPANKAKLVLRGLGQALAVGLLASLLLGVISSLLGALLFHANILRTIALAFWAGLGSALVGLPLTVALVFIIRRLKSNPDDVATPVANLVFNILPLVSIILASRWLA
jgi:cation transporter-like permease